jgi:hypothetical protein
MFDAMRKVRADAGDFPPEPPVPPRSRSRRR